MCKHATKATPVFLPADGFLPVFLPALGHYFQVGSPYYQAAQFNQKTPTPVSSRRQVRSEKARKG